MASQKTDAIHPDHGHIEAAIPEGLPFRKWLYCWLLDPHIKGNHQKSIDHWISILIVTNLVALLLEHVPEVGEHVVCEGWRFEVTEVEGRRIRRVKVTLAPDPQLDDSIADH